jgi:hypothetical protein
MWSLVLQVGALTEPCRRMMMMFDSALAFLFDFEVKICSAPTDVLNYAPRNEGVIGSGARRTVPHF